MEKSESTSYQKKIKWLYIILCIMTAFTIFNIIRNYQVQSFLEEQKKEVEEDLTKMTQSYDIVLADKDSLNESLIQERARIQSLVDSVKTLNASLSTLKYYKRQVRTLRREKRELFLLADSLDRVNQILTTQRDDAEEKLKKQLNITKNLDEKNKKLSKDIELGSTMEARNINIEGIIIENNGEINITNRARRADKLRVCFVLGKNNLVKEGTKTIYAVVNTPQNKLLGKQIKGERFFTTHTGEKRPYSAKINVYYERENLDVCIYVSALKQNLVKGKYLVGLFAEGKFIGEKQLTLR